MPELTRRAFFTHSSAGLAAAATSGSAPVRPSEEIDFRYAPLSGQTAICFPDDPFKTLVGERGDLRYGYIPRSDGFATVVEFSARGMERDETARQWLESPSVPIIRTILRRPKADLHLTAFSSNRAGEGRVDNVLLEIRSRTGGPLRAAPVLTIRTRRKMTGRTESGLYAIGEDGAAPFAVCNVTGAKLVDVGTGHAIYVPERETPVRVLFRFPQEQQTAERLAAGVREPDRILDEVRAYWKSWKVFGSGLSWALPGRYGEFLTACARNIQQAREVRDGKLTFQVGPTCYRGLWIVDGHFILESARYLGYDSEAAQGLEATWARQGEDGGVFAGARSEHWKDTGIAMFTLVRQCELAQDWTAFRNLSPNVLRAVEFLRQLKQKAAGEDSANGRYGLLPKGFGDGGLSGMRSEFTNTLWVVAGLKATVDAAERLGLNGFDQARALHASLRDALFAAAKQEMRKHGAGFEYLPMVTKDDPQWSAADPWNQLRPQGGQWALSHAIYPGLVFEPGHSVVKGHIALMQACTREDVPIETGWLPHEGLWAYNAAFVAHAYLWAGQRDWARRTFHGFLNHATPQYCWREEQPLRGSLVPGYVGDMPHNWASAECVLYLRHMLALEDGSSLRLLEGIGSPELRGGKPFVLEGSPTRFGRIGLRLEPGSDAKQVRVQFKRDAGPLPKRVVLPATLGGLGAFELRGAKFRREGDKLLVEPESKKWEAVWKK